MFEHFIKEKNATNISWRHCGQQC